MSEAISITDVYEELKKIEKNMVTKADIGSLTETIEILSNPETMKQLVEGAEDIRRGRVKQVISVKESVSSNDVGSEKNRHVSPFLKTT